MISLVDNTNLYEVLMNVYIYDFFFFKQKTAYEMRIIDWSSDVCSSDLNIVHRRMPTNKCRLRRYEYQPQNRSCVVSVPTLPHQRFDTISHGDRKSVV